MLGGNRDVDQENTFIADPITEDIFRDQISATDHTTEFSSMARVAHLKPGKSAVETIVGAQFIDRDFSGLPFPNGDDLSNVLPGR